METTCDSSARILNAATRLFAEKGFHGVTTRQIAAASELNMATVHHHLGAKSDVYLAVLRRFYDEEAALVRQFVAASRIGDIEDSGHLRRVLFRLVDAQIMHVCRAPERAWLYMRRWLETAPGVEHTPEGDAAEVAEFESFQSKALFAPLRAIVRRAEKRGLICCQADPAMIIRGFDWLLYSYFTCGPVEGKRWRGDPRAKENLRRFKRFIHTYLISMLQLNE